MVCIRNGYDRGAMLPQIEAFLEVARRENLSRAAEALFVSQPTLTARLQSLEAALGEQLFVRTRRGMRLTEAGEAFLPYAEHALRALADGRERLGELRRGVAGEVLVLFGRSSSFLEFTTATFRQAGVLPNSVLELDNIEAAKKMVEQGLGVSLVPASTVTTELATGVLTAIELVDAAPVRREIVAARRIDAGPPSGAAGLFLEMLAASPPPA